MLNKIITELKKKKTVSSLGSQFIKDRILEYFDKKPDARKRLEEHPKPFKSREFRSLLKNIRKKLHDVYGIFNLSRRSLKPLERYLKKKKKIDKPVLELHKDILSSHKSSKERLEDYSHIYKKIFMATGKPKTILDLACGLNPLSYPWMSLYNLDYKASELTEEDCRFIQEYFNLMKQYTGLRGHAFQADLLKKKKLPECDVCFLFKVLDSLETLKKGISECLLKRIHAKFIVVSFPTKTISGKRNIKVRRWFLKLLEKLKYTYNSFETENEMFYIIKK